MNVLRRIYDSPALLALLPAVAVIIDYSLTFFLSSGNAMILQWEASPLVRFAVAHNIMAAYLLAMIIFYFGTAYAVLRILQPTPFYFFGVTLVLLVSVTHVLGGISWQVKNAWYSNSIITLSLLSVIISITFFGYCLISRNRSEKRHSLK